VEKGGEAGGKLVYFDRTVVFATDDIFCVTAEIMGISAYGQLTRQHRKMVIKLLRRGCFPW